MSDLVLLGEPSFTSPWVLHAMVALEEKGLPYRLELVPTPMSAADRARLQARATLAKVPILVHGEVGISESLAISEYLAETFRAPDHPRLFPADLAERARARQVMGYLRTDTFALRAERPTTSILGAPVGRPLSDAARGEADELVRIAERVVRGPWMFEAWNIADTDLALALLRLARNGDPVPARLADYAERVWARPSTRRFVALAPTGSS